MKRKQKQGPVMLRLAREFLVLNRASQLLVGRFIPNIFNGAAKQMSRLTDAQRKLCERLSVTEEQFLAALGHENTHTGRHSRGRRI